MHLLRSSFASLAAGPLGGLLVAVVSASPVSAQDAGTTIVLDGRLTFEGTITLTIPPGYESLPSPVPAPPATSGAPATSVPVAPPPPTYEGPPIVTVVPGVAPPAAAQEQVHDAPSVDAAPVRTRPRGGLLGGGIALLLGGYALAIGMGLDAPGRPEQAGWSFMPLAGPLIQLSYGEAEWRAPFFVLAPVMQLAGAIVTLIGAASRVPVEAPGTPPSGGGQVRVVPYASTEGAGVALDGAF